MKYQGSQWTIYSGKYYLCEAGEHLKIHLHNIKFKVAKGNYSLLETIPSLMMDFLLINRINNHLYNELMSGQMSFLDHVFN